MHRFNEWNCSDIVRRRTSFKISVATEMVTFLRCNHLEEKNVKGSLKTKEGNNLKDEHISEVGF